MFKEDKIFNDILNTLNSKGKIDIYKSMQYFSLGFESMRIQFTDIEVSTITEALFYNSKRKKMDPVHEYAYPGDPKNPISLISLYDQVFDKYFFFTFRSDFENDEKVVINFRFKKDTKIGKKEISYDIPCKWIIFSFNNEKEMLRKYAKFVNSTRPYMLTGWYFEDYDVPYIIRRYERLGIKDRKILSPDGRIWCFDVEKESVFNRHGFNNHIEGVNLFDMLWGYEYLFGKHSDGNGLGRTGMRHLGLGKASDEIGKEEWYFNDFIKPKKGQIITSNQMEDENENGFMKFIYYGFIDVLILKLLEDKLSILMSFYFIISFSCGEWSKVHNETTLLDAAALNFKDEDLFLPSKRGREYERIKGAEVLLPPAGFHYGFMMIMDLSREYPNIIRGANLGEETYIDPSLHEKFSKKDVVRLGNGHWFKKDVTSFASRMVTLFFLLRDAIEEIRDQYDPNSEMYDIWSNIRQKVKDLINTIYGWMTNPHTRVFHQPSAESITYLGRDLMEHNDEYQKKLRRFFLRTPLIINTKRLKIYIDLIYGDTDSIFIWTDLGDLDDVIILGYKIAEYLNKTYDKFCAKHNMFREYTEIAFESVYENMFIPPRTKGGKYGKKKNYTALKVWGDGKKIDPPKFIMKGMSGKKGNSPIISADVQKNLHKKGCYGEKKPEILKWLREMVKVGIQSMTRPYDIDIVEENGKVVKKKIYKDYDMEALIRCAIPHNFGMDPFDYKTNDASVRVCRYLLENYGIRIREGDTIMYFWIRRVDHPKLPDTNVFGFNPENPFFPKHFEIDIDRMLKKTIYMKIKDIIPFFNIEWNEIINDYINKNMMDFFQKKV